MRNLENIDKISHILLINEPLEYAQDYIEDKNPQYFKLFCENELSIKMAKAVIDESYIASDELKTIMIAANSYSVVVQNALLKILEEPPSDVVFIMVAKQKSAFLSTIRSRLPIINEVQKEKIPHFALDIKTLNLNKIYEFLKESQKDFDNSKLKVEIQSLFLDCIACGLEFDKDEMKMFEEAVLWERQLAREYYVLLPLLMMINEKLTKSRMENVCKTLTKS